MSSRLQGASDRFAEGLAVAREWLRRAMPRVAVAAVALYVLRLLISDTWLYRSTPVGLVGVLTFFAVCATVVYYGLKILVRLKRLLLWRVRRRLIITYLFVGLTPVVLLLLLGALAATGGSGLDAGEERAPLPAWLEGAQEWGGLAYLPPPADSQSAFGTPSVRALARKSSQGRAVAVLVTVPVSRALVKRIRENTGLT